jgi:hypothetical protein
LKPPFYPESVSYPSSTKTGQAQLQYLQRHSEILHVDICITDEEYKELVLHSDLLTLPDFIILYVAAPVLAALLAEYLMKKLGSRQDKTTVKTRITLTDKEGKRSVKVSYEGNATDFDKIVGGTLRLIDNTDALDELLETADLDYEKRIQRLSAKKKTDEE